jgi:Flp pilus assembly protein TadB
MEEKMNKKEREEENKLFEAIHTNYKNANAEYKMEKQLLDIVKKELAEKAARKAKKRKIAIVVGLVGLLATFVALKVLL